MFRYLLVPTDGSEQLSAALPFVRHLASRTGANVALLCVEPPIANLGQIVANEAVAEVHAEKVRLLERCIEDLQREGIQAHYDIEFGRPEHSITVAAKGHGTDLIVMTPHHRQGFDAVLHPSITARMFSTAPAPLLIIPERAANGVRAGLLADHDAVVVVPLDGSALAEHSLPIAATLAQEYQRGLHLVRVVLPLYGASTQSDRFTWQQLRLQAAQHEARSYLHRLQADIKQATGLPVTTEVTLGEPAPEVADIAAEAPTNLIVMSTHGHGTLGRLFLGSVATAVMERATVPVLVIPPLASLDAPVDLDAAAHLIAARAEQA